jgi:hypothetical protein
VSRSIGKPLVCSRLVGSPLVSIVRSNFHNPLRRTGPSSAKLADFGARGGSDCENCRVACRVAFNLTNDRSDHCLLQNSSTSGDEQRSGEVGQFARPWPQQLAERRANQSRNRTPGPPPFFAINSIPAFSRAPRTSSSVRGYGSLAPRSKSAIVFVAVLLAAESRRSYASD